MGAAGTWGKASSPQPFPQRSPGSRLLLRFLQLWEVLRAGDIIPLLKPLEDFAKDATKKGIPTWVWGATPSHDLGGEEADGVQLWRPSDPSTEAVWSGQLQGQRLGREHTLLSTSPGQTPRG